MAGNTAYIFIRTSPRIFCSSVLTLLPSISMHSNRDWKNPSFQFVCKICVLHIHNTEVQRDKSVTVVEVWAVLWRVINLNRRKTYLSPATSRCAVVSGKVARSVGLGLKRTRQTETQISVWAQVLFIIFMSRISRHRQVLEFVRCSQFRRIYEGVRKCVLDKIWSYYQGLSFRCCSLKPHLFVKQIRPFQTSLPTNSHWCLMSDMVAK